MTGTRRNQVPGWVLLGLVCIGQFMVVLDISIVNVALPSIQTDLGFSTSGLQWVVNAYTLTFAGFLLLGGRAGDIFGRRRMFLIGLGMFTAASFLGGFAQTQTMLLVARALQGLGGAVLAPATLTILTTTFPEGPERARALGVWTAVAAAGASVGALLGGVLTELASWRWILFVNVPVGVIALVAAARLLPESRSGTTRRHLDVAGALTVTGGLVALIFAIVQTETYAWSAEQVLVPLAVSVVLIAAFLLIEARFASTPLMPLRIFRVRSIATGNLFVVLLYAALFGSFYFETLYLQRILGYSPIVAGIAFLPIPFVLAAGSQIASRAVTRWGARPLLLAGTVTAGVGLFWLSKFTPESTFVADLLGPFLLSGLGMGLAITPVAVAATAGVAREEAGLASGLLNTARQVGISVGLAVLATVAANRTAQLLAGVAPTSSGTADAVVEGYARAIELGVLIMIAAAIVAAVGLGPVRRERVTVEENEGGGPRDVVPIVAGPIFDDEAESA